MGTLPGMPHWVARLVASGLEASVELQQINNREGVCWGGRVLAQWEREERSSGKRLWRDAVGRGCREVWGRSEHGSGDRTGPR